MAEKKPKETKPTQSVQSVRKAVEKAPKERRVVTKGKRGGLAG